MKAKARSSFISYRSMRMPTACPRIFRDWRASLSRVRSCTCPSAMAEWAAKSVASACAFELTSSENVG